MAVQAVLARFWDGVKGTKAEVDQRARLKTYHGVMEEGEREHQSDGQALIGRGLTAEKDIWGK